MKSSRPLRVASISALALLAVSAAYAQGPTWDLCLTPGNDQPKSNPFIYNKVGNALAGVSVGGSGTVSYGGGPDGGKVCFENAITANIAFRFGFWVGGTGSVQSDTDNFMAQTFGMPDSPGGSWGGADLITVAPDGTITRTKIGSTGSGNFFQGASDTYIYSQVVLDNVDIRARFDVIGDAVRIQWDLQNIAADARGVGLTVGHEVALLTQDGRSNQAIDVAALDAAFNVVPGRRPLRTEQRFIRAQDPVNFPSELSFNLNQREGYGLRVNTSLSNATTDPLDQSLSLTPADELVHGIGFFLLGFPGGGDAIFPDGFVGVGNPTDVGALGEPAYLEKYYPQRVASGGSRRIVQFYNSPWSDASYSRPYSVVVDTPKVVNLSTADATTFAQNPFTVRVWVDNNRGFSTLDQELPLEDVRVTLNLGAGLTAVGGNVKTITRINARTMGFVDFQVQADPTAQGDINYTASIVTSPGPGKDVSGIIRVVSQPRLRVRTGANLVTSPFSFNNPVWSEILGLTPDVDYQAFNYDPQRNGYVISTGPDRGRGTWLISKSDRGFVTLGSNPTKPTDDTPDIDGGGGSALIALKQGWNLIGNPYPISIPLGQIIGSTNANPQQAYTFNDLVQQGVISGSLAYYDADAQTYRFIQGLTASIEPQRGYWIYVATEQDVILRFPPVYQVNYRSSDKPTAWTQSDKQWRLQLAARTSTSGDDQNFIGIAPSDKAAAENRMYEPPIAPLPGAVGVSVEQNVDGKDVQLAQALATTGTRQSFKVRVESRDEGPVTLTWPNLSTIPKNVRVRLTDTATGEVRDLRKFSGYTYTAESRSIRNLQIDMEPGVANRVVIGNVVVTRDSRDSSRNAPVTINYTLGSDATTTVRVLSTSGREIYSVTRGRADKAGSNTVTWNLRDNANRAVAPGTYRVEIMAEGDGGERVRKYVPVTIVR